MADVQAAKERVVAQLKGCLSERPGRKKTAEQPTKMGSNPTSPKADPVETQTAVSVGLIVYQKLKEKYPLEQPTSILAVGRCRASLCEEHSGHYPTARHHPQIRGGRRGTRLAVRQANPARRFASVGLPDSAGRVVVTDGIQPPVPRRFRAGLLLIFRNIGNKNGRLCYAAFELGMHDEAH